MRVRREGSGGAAAKLVEGAPADDPRARSLVQEVRRLPRGRCVLAVSGGPDSMALLDLVWRAGLGGRVAAVATFDHRTGPWAERAAGLVAEEGARRGLPVVMGRAERSLAGESEATWRRARWRFLREVATAHRAPVVTAHTRDDQVETVLMRVLRSAGARGLAGLDVDGPVRRPLLAASRRDLRWWLERHEVPFVDDPSNADRRFLRARVRHDLLPALRDVSPRFDEELLRIGHRAATWRRAVERWAAAVRVRRVRGGAVHVARAPFAGYDYEALATLWPAVAARAGTTLDRRGTRRLAGFTRDGRTGGRVQLAGGVEVVLLRDRFVFRPLEPAPGGGRTMGHRAGTVRAPSR